METTVRKKKCSSFIDKTRRLFVGPEDDIEFLFEWCRDRIDSGLVEELAPPPRALSMQHFEKSA